ncbi:MAG: CDP-diacylglycerol--glycerol-3-phosphate 3-phosphatidyltransferase [Coriobacteriales bacterium]|nr:CDP-diacylglycerol--glycerol-3-phosphate 3-phosphatidyltransferase [Coriobacteriales bacterium]
MVKSKVGGGVWTPANIVTVLRICLMPLWLLVAEFSVPAQTSISVSALVVFLGFMFISLTDKLDGYLARSRGEVTTFGKFLDPIADKLAVVVAFCYLLEIGMSSSWVLLIVVAREFLVSGLRMVVANEGVVVAASNLGKWKTAITMIAICGLLFVRIFVPSPFVDALLLLSNILVVISVILTAWSGIDYFIQCWPYVAEKK